MHSHTIPLQERIPDSYRDRFILCCRDTTGISRIVHEIKAQPPQSFLATEHDHIATLFSKTTLKTFHSKWDFWLAAVVQTIRNQSLTPPPLDTSTDLCD